MEERNDMAEEKRIVAVLPARYASSRFPGKPLASIAGKSMIQRTYEAALRSSRIQDVIVATDDRRIHDAVVAFGGTAVLTSPNHETGTDRIAEAIRGLAADLIVNVQGDEPLMPSNVLDELIERMLSTGADMATAAVPFGLTRRDPSDPNAVKVVCDADGFALYFSRSLIPFRRAGGHPVEPLLHWGVYAYTKTFLERFVRWPRGRLEQCEMLEQLRALEHGARILVVEADELSLGVDVPEDIALVERILAERGER